MAIEAQHVPPDTSQAADSGDLIAPGLVRVEHHPLPAKLQPFVTTLFTLRCDEPLISDMLPAGVGYLAILQSGSGTVHFASGRCDPAHRETLLTPTSAAVALRLDGPWHMAAAALSPLGWAALTGLDAGQHADRACDAAQVLGEAVTTLGERLRALHRAAPHDRAALAAELARFIQPRLRPVNPRHIQLIAAVTDWLSSGFDPDLAGLRRATGLSPRQLQRLVVRYYGTGPKQLARKYRALRVASLLQSEETGDEQAAALINLFYDQSHLIREMRQFVGRTPLRLAKGEAPVLAAATALRNYREIKPNVARIPGD